jgi:ABC-2 type transport system permease protein
VLAFGLKPIHSGVQKLVIHTTAKPTFAGIDPYNFYVDRNSDDNVKPVTGG